MIPDVGDADELQEHWRQRLVEAQRQFAENRCRENREELLRVLKSFTELVIRGKVRPT
jgi:hypothetical protein